MLLGSYESVGRGFESLPSHQERPEHNVFWSFFFCAWKGLEQHGRAAGEANNSPVGCCLVRGDHRLGMSAVEPELCSGLSFFVRGRDSNSTAEPQARQTTARWAVVWCAGITVWECLPRSRNCVLVFLFLCVEGLEQHGRAAGEANNSPVGCCLVRGDHRPGMSIVEAVDRKISWLFFVL